MSLSSSLLLILNENGMILNYRIVPNDQCTFVQECLKEVWSTPGAQKICEVVYTDNPKVDKSFIEQTYLQCHPGHLSVAVLLDIYHARARVIKEMSKYHPDFRAAKQDLASIFATIQQYGHFPTPDDLVDDFEEWCSKYSVVYTTTILPFDEQINFLAAKSKP
jgi:hypothetical protein